MNKIGKKLAFVFSACLFGVALTSHESEIRRAAVPAVPLLKTPTNSIGMKMTLIETDSNGIVISAPYYVSQEITQGQWEKVMEVGKSSKNAGDLPVTNISRKKAQQFCKTLSMIEGREYRLPSEAELEYLYKTGKDGKSRDHKDLIESNGNKKANNNKLRIVCPVFVEQCEGTAQMIFFHVFFDEDAKLVYKPKMTFKQEFARRGYHREYFGTPGSPVLVDTIVGLDGLPKSVNYHGGSTVFKRLAIDYVKQWRFEPAKVDGQPVETRIICPLIFRMKKYINPGGAAEPNDWTWETDSTFFSPLYLKFAKYTF